MADKNIPPTPVAPPAPVILDQADNETAEPIANMIAAHSIKFLADQPSVEALIRGLSPLVKMGILGSPIALARILHNKEIKFLNKEWSDTLKRVLVGVCEEVAEVVTAKGSASNEEIKQAFVKAETAVMESKLVLDPVGLVHMPACSAVGVLKGLKLQMTEITLKAAMAERKRACPTCLNLMQEEIGKAAAAPKSEKKNRSPMEVIGSLKDEELKKKLRLMLNGLSVEDRTRTLEAFRELDSDEELLAILFMADGNPALMIDLLPLLENRDATYAVRKYLHSIGGILKNSWNEVADHYKKWNVSLAPEVERLKSKYHDASGNATPYVKPTWGQSLKKIFSLLPF